eukprot:SAG22_NODE_2891_length_2122_cov_2.223925_1_plen_206_part_00
MDASPDLELLQYGDEIALEYLPAEEDRVPGVRGFVVGTPELSDSVSVRFSRESEEGATPMRNQSQARFVVQTAGHYEAAVQLQSEDSVSLRMQLSAASNSSRDPATATLGERNREDTEATEAAHEARRKELIDKANTEALINKNEFELRTGTPLVFGDKLQLSNSMSAQAIMSDKSVSRFAHVFAHKVLFIQPMGHDIHGDNLAA